VRNAWSVVRSARVSGVMAPPHPPASSVTRVRGPWDPGSTREAPGARGGLPNVGGAASGESHPSDSHTPSMGR
jgi:hypothetical protein